MPMNVSFAFAIELCRYQSVFFFFFFFRFLMSNVSELDIGSVVCAFCSLSVTLQRPSGSIIIAIYFF